jgi:hypothetical protein
MSVVNKLSHVINKLSCAQEYPKREFTKNRRNPRCIDVGKPLARFWLKPVRRVAESGWKLRREVIGAVPVRQALRIAI